MNPFLVVKRFFIAFGGTLALQTLYIYLSLGSFDDFFAYFVMLNFVFFCMPTLIPFALIYFIQVAIDEKLYVKWMPRIKYINNKLIRWAKNQYHTINS
jgi:hypothetical protein